MEKFYLEEVNLDRKDDVTDYVSEFKKYNSDINGTGGFHHILDGDSFENILEKEMSLHDTDYALSVGMCPGKTFLLIRENDNKLIGMMNIRHHLNKQLLEFGGHIGYSIRPTERRKGYAKINLYLGLIKSLEEFGLDRVMIDCSATNIGSEKTIQALGGVFERSGIDWYDDELTNVYWIDTKDSIEKYRNYYSDYIYNKRK